MFWYGLRKAIEVFRCYNYSIHTYTLIYIKYSREHTLDFRVTPVTVLRTWCCYPNGCNQSYNKDSDTSVHTFCPRVSLYTIQSCRASLQYSTRNCSAYSWPWPLPKRPCVSVLVIKWGRIKSTSRYSRTSLLICAFGHHAPPFFSCRILQKEEDPALTTLKFMANLS